MKKVRTPFGKKFKIIRVLHDEDINDAAKFLGVSASYVTCVEYGDRDIPQIWVSKIIEHYKLNDKDKDELLQSVRESPIHRRIDLSKMEQILLNFVENISKGNDKAKKEGQIRARKIIDELRNSKTGDMKS